MNHLFFFLDGFMNLGQSLFSLALFGINTKGAKMMKGLDKFNKITIDVSPKIVHLPVV
jgi:hypothetical protein